MKQYQNTVNTSTHITKTPTQLSKHTLIHTTTHYNTHAYTHPHITTPAHTHNHTLQHPHIHTTTHYNTHTYTHPHITTPTHTLTHTLKNKLKPPQCKIHTKLNITIQSSTLNIWSSNLNIIYFFWVSTYTLTNALLKPIPLEAWQDLSFREVGAPKISILSAD
jgi:hypothetical protein